MTSSATVPATTVPPGHRPAAALIRPGAVAGAVAAATTYLAVVDPHQGGHYPTCPFLFLTGLWCPGCGSLRAVHDLAHGDLAGALGMNPLTVATVPVLVLMWAAWVRRAASGRPAGWFAPGWAVWSFLGVVLAFWVLRNLPWFSFLAP